MPNSLRVMHIKHFMAKSIAGKFHIKYNIVTGRPVLLPHRQLRLLGHSVLFLYTFLKHKHMDEYLKIFFHVLVLFTPYSFPWPVHLFSFLSFLFIRACSYILFPVYLGKYSILSSPALRVLLLLPGGGTCLVLSYLVLFSLSKTK